MAKKRTSSGNKTQRKSGNRKGTAKKKSGFSLGKFTLGLFILIGLGYAGLAIWEGKLFPDSLDQIELPSFGDEPASDTDKTTPSEDNDKKEDEEIFDFDGFDLYFTKAFDFFWPAYNTEEAVIERPYYTLRYSEEHEQAIWVAYPLWADSLRQQKHERKDDFREDPRVRTGSAQLTDYRGSGYDRGHLAPAADFSYDDFALSQSFYMSNMSPQDPSFNRGIWKKLEDKVRDWAMENDHIYIVTGPVLNKKFETIGSNQVSVPEYYYKIVLDIQRPEIKAIAFLMKNEKSSAELQTFIVTIDEVEKLTGLDFFPAIPDEMENALESRKSTLGWF